MGNTNSDNAPPPIIIEEPAGSLDSLPSSSTSLGPRQNSASTVDPARVTPLLADRMALLVQLPQFGRLPEHTIFNLAELMREVTYTDAPIFTSGEESNEFFIIKEGTVSCCKPSESSDPAEPPSDAKEVTPQTCEQLRQGECFGDSALINNLPRTFSAKAVGTVVCCVLDRASFQRVFAILDPAHLKKRRGFTGNVGKRIRRVPSAMLERRDSSRALSLDSKSLIARAIAANQLLSKLDEAQKEAISVSMWSKRVQQGQPVISQGDEGDAFYVIDQGEFRVTIRRSDGTEQNISTLRSGASFGEMALLYNAPRSASITAATDGLLWSIDRFAFQRIIAKESRAKLESTLSLLGHVKTFSYLAGYERTMLAEAFEEVSFRDGQAIYEVGDPSNAFFVVKEGMAVRLPDGPELGAEFGPYTHFGEAELLEAAAENGDRPVRSHTVRAKGPTVVLRLDDLTFETLLAPLDEVFRCHTGSLSVSVPTTPVDAPASPGFDKPPGLPRSLTSPELAIRKIGLPATMLSTRFSTVKLTDLEVIRTLGRGSFGVVKLVRHKESGELFALKKLSKRRIREMGGETQVISETQVMAMLDSPFLCKLYASFQDRNCVYMLMETCLGGDIYNLLQSQRRFTEDTARFYAACTVLAMEGVHASRVIYRDLKPENLLLDRDGYVKLIDFGFAKVARQGRTWTVCGTPEYMAPEQLLGTGHSEAVDWWALGVFIFEMLAGYTPFRDEDPSKVYSKIANYSGNLWLPVHFTADAKDIIRKFLDVKPLNRLGSGRNGLEAIKAHPWFRGIDWISLKARLLPSPYLPPIDVAEDGSGFDLEDVEEALSPDQGQAQAPVEDDPAFKDFAQAE